MPSSSHLPSLPFFHASPRKTTTIVVHRQHRSNQPSPPLKPQRIVHHRRHGHRWNCGLPPSTPRRRFCPAAGLIATKQPMQHKIISPSSTWRADDQIFPVCSPPMIGHLLHNFGQSKIRPFSPLPFPIIRRTSLTHIIAPTPCQNAAQLICRNAVPPPLSIA